MNCFVERKCAFCETDCRINEKNIDDYIYYDKKFYHNRCFITLCNEKLLSKRTKTEKWVDALEKISVLQKEAKMIIHSELYKTKIYKLISENYDLNIIPKNFFYKLNNILNGTYPGVLKPIPIEHIYDMWRRKIPMLNSINNRNISMGKVLSKSERINYDLSILINKYDDYLNFITKQKILKSEERKKESSDLIFTEEIVNIKSKTKDKNSNYITSIVDDIFD